MRVSTRFARRAGITAVLLLVAACGHHHHYPDYIGDIAVDNLSDLSVPVDLLTFEVAAFGQPWSGDLLFGAWGGPLLPGEAVLIGTFDEDYYDARGDLSDGLIVEWFDEFVGEELTTWFEVP